MKKKSMTLMISFVLLAVLVVVYIAVDFLKPPPEEKSSSGFMDKYTQLISRQKDEVTSVTVTNKDGEVMEFLPHTYINESGREAFEWVLAGHEDFILNSGNVENLVRTTYEISAAEVLTETPENLADYGLQPPLVTTRSNFTDGTSEVLYIGRTTPSKEEYYCMVEGDDRVFLLSSYTGERFYYTMDDLIDKTTMNSYIDQDYIQYIYIGEKTANGLSEVEFDFLGTEEEKKEEFEKYGFNIIKMNKPYIGREYYAENFKMNILTNFSEMTLNKIIDIEPKDIGVYGLDDPMLTISIADLENGFSILIGNEADSSNYYCLIPGRPHVFTIEKIYINPFLRIDPFKFIDRFMALVYIDTVESMEIDGLGYSYDIETHHEQLPPEEGEEEGEKIMKPTVNGVQVQEDAFKTLYTAVIALAADSQIEMMTPTAPPVLTIYYHRIGDNDDAVVRLYEYNTDFYAAQRDDYPIQFVVNKHSVKILFDTMNDLLAGKLNRY